MGQLTHSQNVDQIHALRAIDLPQAKQELENDANSEMLNQAMRMSNPKLSALRAQNPFLSIVPFPNAVINVLLGAGGVATDIDLPPGTKYINIRATSEYFVSRVGNAQLPTAAKSQTGSCSFDPSQYVYVEEVSQFSIISTGANNAVCIACYAQL